MEKINEALRQYFEEIEGRNLILASEYSLRTPLENLLNAIKPDNFQILHEPKSEKGESICPDFKIYQLINPQNALSYNALVGFIECKKWGEDLDKHLKSKQLERYSQISPNIILTNYNRFILLNFGKKSLDCTLFNADKTTISPKPLQDLNKFQEFYTLLLAFFRADRAAIVSKDELVRVLSSQSFYLSDCLGAVYHQSPRTSFHKFFEKTKETFENITQAGLNQEQEFCDILAQSIVYGMFVAFMESPLAKDSLESPSLESLHIDNIANLLPSGLELLSEFIYFSIPNFNFPSLIRETLESVRKSIVLIDRAAIVKETQNEVDLVAIYLYEDFLKAYDKLRETQNRKEGGVFYTPKPIVEMIVSSLHRLLKDKLNKKKGFGDKDVKVLDFATGTGSFLACIFKLILEQEKNKVFKNEVIKEKFFKDIYGFEISFVPYIVAHIKLSAILKQAGFNDELKLQIFLTNTLNLSREANYKMTMPLVHLEEEDLKAREIKHSESLLVILGNPPYNVKSKNKGKEILELLQSYKQGLNETNIQPLDDDYIKFMRFAQWKLLEQRKNTLFENPKGLLGFITNNSFLSGRIHRKMRESLYKSFDEIYILNLHGSDKEPKKEDKNVFDIQVGVCISLFVKYKDTKESEAKLYYYSTLENEIYSRSDKFALLNELSTKGLGAIKWQELNPTEPYFWFVPKNLDNAEYEDFWALAPDKGLGDSKVIFENFRSGIQTKRDNLAIQLKKEYVKSIVEDFKNLDSVSLSEKYNISNSSSWSIEAAKKDIEKNQGEIQKIAYRPFDMRYTYYTTKQGFLGRPFYETMQHFLLGENLGLCFSKDYQFDDYDTPIITDLIVDIHYNGGQCYIAPLYCFINSANEVGKIDKIPNFTANFKAYCQKHKILKHKSPEAILCFIYANLFNPTYRKTYLEYLKSGFPRVNFEVDSKTFESYEKLGQKLLKLHLLQTIPQNSKIQLAFRENANKENPSKRIEKLKEENRFKEGKLILNEDLCLENLPESVYNYTIGGYKCLKKWIDYRVGYSCEKEDLEHLENLAKILLETLRIQEKLEELQ
ncbi:MAG: N-6 DNA methylase [Helicobacter sp.]|nr:N-6 DNA methylase [Helicobacter sp.]